MRDDFKAGVIKKLAARAGHRCSNPGCRASTSGPQLREGEAVNVGVASHITGAATNGPRYDPSLTPTQRRSINNAIWLCQTCGKIIDGDYHRYSVETLLGWRQTAEQEAHINLGKAKGTVRDEATPCGRWWSTFVGGTSFHLESGIAGTAKEPNGHPPSLFPLEKTVILGDSGKANPSNPASHTVAHWSIPTSEFPIQLYTRGYLLIACLRRFGGLHSPTFKDWVQILLNGDVLDGFELQYAPQGHRDYFHQVPYPNAPRVAPFSDCETVYSWPIPKSHLRLQPDQQIIIRLDRDTKWDIDYIGFLFEFPQQPPKVFISHNFNDRVLARRLAADLKSRGIGVWIDEAEIKLGDSLLKKIQEGIDVVDYVLVLISQSSIGSAWVNKEVEIAMTQEIAGKRVKVFVVLIDDVELPSFLKSKQYADLRSLTRYKDVLVQIERRVTSQ